MTARRAIPVFLFVVLALLAAPFAHAQVSMTALGTPIPTQTFDSLATTGTANPWADNSTLAGWYAQFASTTNPTTYRADSGGSNTGAIYSWGVLGTNPLAERAFGSIGSGGTGTVHYALRLVNNTGSTITSLDVSFIGEQWRQGGCASNPCPGPGTPLPQTVDFQYRVANAGAITDANTPTTGWTDHNALDFTSPQPGASNTAAALDGNAAANRTSLSSTLTVTVNPGQEIWLRWVDVNHADNDHGLAIDTVNVTPQGAANSPVSPTCPATLTTNAGTATSTGVSATDSDGTVTSATITGITPSDPGTITLTGFTPAGGVGDTATATLNVSNTTPAGTYNVTIQWANNDATPQTANCVVAVTVNPPPTITFIHTIQGSGPASGMIGANVTVEGIVVGDYQTSSGLLGFFLQEEDADANAEGNPATSEGIFVFCNTCPTAVSEGHKVQVTGVVSEFNGMTEITASTAGSVVITDAGNNLAQVTAATIDLPIAGSINDFYEAREAMLVSFVDTLSISEYFELHRYGQIELYEGGRPRQFAEANAPSAAGYTAHLDNLDRRRVILDDTNDVENVSLTMPDGSQFVYHPRANGGFSAGTQGVDFFRGGDTVTGLTGVLDWSFAGASGTDAWRVRPTSLTASSFTVANPRPATPPAVGGAIKVASMNMLNYFTTIDTTSSNSSGPCGPGGTQDCRGADSTAELNRQRERASIVICSLNPDVAGLMEMENTTATGAITDLLGAVNARCGGANPYDFVNTGGTLGTDAIRVNLIYRTNILAPVGPPHVDLDPVHNRPPTAQTFDVVDAANPAFGERFTVIASHFKSKGSCPGSGAEADQNDGQGCWNPTRVAQASRLLTWVNGTVVPAAGDPDVVLVGDFNAYAQEDPITTIEAGGYTDTEEAFLGANAYSYLFDGQLGHIDYAFTSASLTPQVVGVSPWHINADEVPLFDYNDEIRDTGEAAFEEKPNGAALVPPRVVFQPSSPYRAADHDPVILGLFAISDLVITKTGSPDPVTAGNNLTYTITVTNNGPDSASNASWTDTLPTGTTFVSLPAVTGWSCTTPAVGAAGTVTCSNPSFGVGNAAFTLTVNVGSGVAAATVLSNTATVTSAGNEGNPGDESATAATTVATSADLLLSKTDSPDPVNAGSNVSYQLTLTNNGPSAAANATFSDTLPAGTTFVSLSTTGSWTCTTPAVGAPGAVNCSNTSFGVTVDFFTIVVNVDPSVADGTVLSNTATLSSATTDPNGTNNSDTATTTVAVSADLLLSKTDSPDPVNAGSNLSYQITITNNGPSNAANASWTDTLPAGTTFVSLSTTGSWTCTTPAVGATGTVTCSNTNFLVTADFFTIVVNVDPGVADGTVLSNTATVSSATADPNGANNSATATTTVTASADLLLSKTDSPDPVTAGSNLTYTITATNAGPSDATTVSLSDTLPAGTTFVSLSQPGGWTCTTPAVGATGTVTCTLATFPASGSGVFTLVVNVGASTATGTILSNTATITTATPDHNGSNNSATATTTVGVGSADVRILKDDTPISSDPINAGEPVVYTIIVNNDGPSAAADVSWSDTLPAGTTFLALHGEAVPNPVPAGWTCTTPAVGATGTVTCSIASLGITTSSPRIFTLILDTDPSLAAGTVLSNTVTVSSATSDPNGANNSSTETTTLNNSADVQVTKSDSPDPVTAGTNITYAINVTNAGPSNAASVALADTLPTGTTFEFLSAPAGWTCTTPSIGGTGTVNCSIASLTAGTVASFSLVVHANPGLGDGTVITNTASVSSATPDVNSSNNNATANTTIGIGSADLAVTKTDTPDPVNAGANLTYTITVTNNGPTNAASASLSDTLPANTTFVSLSSPAGWSCTMPAVGATGTVTCTNPSVAAGSSAFTLVVNVSSTTAPGTVLSNTATVSSTTADPSPGNESATATTTVQSPANVTGTKTVSGSSVPGTNITYTIVLSNSGPAPQQNNPGDELTDVLPPSLILVSATANSGTAVANVGTNTVTWNGSIPAGGSVTINITATIRPDVAPGTTINNQGTIAYDADGNGTNESTRQTDDPSEPGGADATPVVVGESHLAKVPTLDEWALMALAAMLGMVALLVMKR